MIFSFEKERFVSTLLTDNIIAIFRIVDMANNGFKEPLFPNNLQQNK